MKYYNRHRYCSVFQYHPVREEQQAEDCTTMTYDYIAHSLSRPGTLRMRRIAIPTGSFRAPYSWTGLGSRRTQANNTSTAPTGSHKISRGSRDRVDVVCGPSHPGRALNERRVEGRKVEAAAEPRQLEFLRRKDRDREEEASLGSARPRVPLALFARSFRLSSLYLPRSRVPLRAHIYIYARSAHTHTHTHAYTTLSRGHSGIELSSLPPPTAAGPPDTSARARQGRKDRRRNRNGRGRE